MKVAFWRGKRTLKQWQEDKLQGGHHERLKNIRPTSSDRDWQPLTLNPNKKLMQQEDKFTQMQRQNRHLLEKITTTMNKSTQRNNDKDKMNRSLHAPFRRKQLESIEVQNARLLKRLQQKKSDYPTVRLKQEWRKQKQVIKNIAHYPFILRTSIRTTTKRRAISKVETESRPRNRTSLSSDIQLVRIRNIDSLNFVITLRLDQEKMQIIGEHKNNQTKVIQIPREEALAFIQYQCNGKLEAIFDQLSYNQEEEVLYLSGRDEGPQLKTIEEKISHFQEDKTPNK